MFCFSTCVWDQVIMVSEREGCSGVDLFVCQAEDGIRDLVRSRGLGDVYKRQLPHLPVPLLRLVRGPGTHGDRAAARPPPPAGARHCLLYTSDAADERSSVDLGGRRIIKKKNT